MALCYYEGYIRNRRQLCRDLGLPDGTTEQAILETGYRRWGAGLGHRLYGAFAFAFRNQADGSLFCARDQLGLQPFFYCLAGNGELLFSGDVNDIIGDPRYRPALDLQALQNYMSFGYPIGENTLWQGVRKLMPGQTLAFRAGKPVISTYYKPVYAPEHDRAEAYWTSQIEATLRAILSEDRENHDFRSTCAFLSSGVDSSWLLALSGVRRAIGIGYPGEACSEAALAADRPGRWTRIFAGWIFPRKPSSTPFPWPFDAWGCPLRTPSPLPSALAVKSRPGAARYASPGRARTNSSRVTISTGAPRNWHTTAVPGTMAAPE